MKYIFLTPSVGHIGGAEIYISNKTAKHGLKKFFEDAQQFLSSGVDFFCSDGDKNLFTFKIFAEKHNLEYRKKEVNVTKIFF